MKRPKPIAVRSGLSGALWSTPLRRKITSCTALFGLFAALGGAIKAGPEIEPYAPAVRGYVRDHVAQLNPTINQLLRWQAEDRKSKIDAETAQWNIRLPTEQDAQTRTMIERRLEQLKDDKKKIDSHIDAIGK